MIEGMIHPFKNEEESYQIGELTIENRVDRVSIYGSIDLTLDKTGLAYAQWLKEVLELTVAEMGKKDLPDKIVVNVPEIVESPFT